MSHLNSKANIYYIFTRERASGEFPFNAHAQVSEGFFFKSSFLLYMFYFLMKAREDFSLCSATQKCFHSSSFLCLTHHETFFSFPLMFDSEKFSLLVISQIVDFFAFTAGSMSFRFSLFFLRCVSQNVQIKFYCEESS